MKNLAELLQRLRLNKGLSLEEMDAIQPENISPVLARALGMVTKQLRETEKCRALS